MAPALMGFSSLLTAFKGFFSRAFWFSRFLPVALIALAHAMLANWVFGWEIRGGFASILKENSNSALLTIAALVVLAYALSPMIPTIGALLDGSLLPEWLHNRLREDRRAALNSIKDRPGSAYRAHSDINATRDQWVSALWNASKAGNDLDRISDEPAIATADAAVGKLPTDPPPVGADLLNTIEQVGTALQAALAANSSNLKNDNPAVNLSIKLDASHQRFRDFLKKLVEEAAHRARAAQGRLDITDTRDFQPTRFGDARSIFRRYAEGVYKVPLDYLWPRVRLAILDGEESSGKGAPRMVADGAAQVDFVVFLFALWWSVPVLWLPLIVARQGPIEALLAVGLAAPLIGRALYELAIQAEKVAGSAMAVALDRYHRDALKELGFEPPATLSAERRLWDKLNRARAPGIELVYAKPAKAES